MLTVIRWPRSVVWGEEAHREDACGHEVYDGGARPHDGTGEFLVSQNRDCSCPRHAEVIGVNHAIAKGEVRREDVARQRSKEDVKKDQPTGLKRHRRPRLKNRPPEQEACEYKTEMLDGMHAGRRENKGKNIRYMPANEHPRSP